METPADLGSIRRATGRRQLWSFQDTKVIDDLVDAMGTRSRSELISCALETYLLPRRRR
ncbi:ribbon-helix-helix protein, CopG family [Nonomuraea jabiensis]|uniref:ribbon-helix-helix protein, CopG family n=1 Tax=Nonomuraea jabiensis TaxID=882448 RepID=UPI003D762B5A